MGVYVYSTATCDNVIAVGYDASGRPAKRILLKGGHGVANKHFITPQGVVTEVSDDDADILRNHPTFQRMMKAGFYVMEGKRIEPEKVAASMKGRDGSAPLVPQDYELNGKKSPKSGKVTDEV